MIIRGAITSRRTKLTSLDSDPFDQGVSVAGKFRDKGNRQSAFLSTRQVVVILCEGDRVGVAKKEGRFNNGKDENVYAAIG